MIFVAWLRERRPVEGWVSHEIEAATHAEAVEKARARFAGTHGASTLEVDPQPAQHTARAA